MISKSLSRVKFRTKLLYDSGRLVKSSLIRESGYQDVHKKNDLLPGIWINSEKLIIFGFEQYLGSKKCFLKAHNDLHSDMK